MEEKNVIKIRLSTVILCCIIVALIIGMMFMYIYYNKKEENPKNIVENEVINNKNNIQKENTVYSNDIINININQTSKNEILNVNSELVKRLYDYIPVIDSMKYEPYNAYQNQKVTINNIDPAYILGCAFTKISLSEQDKVYIDGWYTFDADLLQQKVKEMYNQNVENKTFNYNADATTCSYSDGRYLWTSGGYYAGDLKSIRSIEKSYISGEELIIEDRYIALKIDYNNPVSELLSSSDSTEVLRKTNIKVMDVSNEAISKEIISANGDIMAKYKHTFKKNANGLYYWYSTEPIF